METFRFEGTPREIGRQYGEALKGSIVDNIAILVHRVALDPLPHDDPAFQRWAESQESLIADNWPFLIEEMRGVADGAGVDYREILYLNLRAWRYNAVYGRTSKDTACSNIAVRLDDGSVALAGSLDDPVSLYGGLIEYAPEGGPSFFGCPITGQCSVVRSVNSAGLALGTSSLPLIGPPPPDKAICQDVATRAIMQTCATAEEVRDFCRAFPFNLNLIAVDAKGGLFCAHCSTGGLIELADSAPCAVTNHVVDDRLMIELNGMGFREFPESPTSRQRRGKLLDFIARRDGRCDGDEVRGLVAERDGGAPSAICPPRNVFVSYANPQSEPGRFWISDPQISGEEAWTALDLK